MRPLVPTAANAIRRQRLPFTTLTALVILIHGAGAAAQKAEGKPAAGLEELRKSYTDSVARAAEVVRPKAGTPDFKEKLSAWSKAQDERTDTIHKLAEARQENERLLKKLNIILREGRLPNLTINFRGGKRTPTSLKREFLLHRSLIEATAGETKAAEAFLEEAKEIEETDDLTDKRARGNRFRA